MPPWSTRSDANHGRPRCGIHEEALDIKAALNDVGYHRGDAVMTDNSKRLARKLAHAYDVAIRDSVSGIPEGEQLSANLDNIIAIMRERDAVFKTPAALVVRRLWSASARQLG